MGTEKKTARKRGARGRRPPREKQRFKNKKSAYGAFLRSELLNLCRDTLSFQYVFASFCE
jgi:hypothetical protein